MQHTKTFLYFLCKKHTLQLITVKHISQILKALLNRLLNPRIYVCVLTFSREIQHDFICLSDT
jgi:hypothetical protein